MGHRIGRPATQAVGAHVCNLHGEPEKRDLVHVCKLHLRRDALLHKSGGTGRGDAHAPRRACVSNCKSRPPSDENGVRDEDAPPSRNHRLAYTGKFPVDAPSIGSTTPWTGNRDCYSNSDDLSIVSSSPDTFTTAGNVIITDPRPHEAGQAGHGGRADCR